MVEFRRPQLCKRRYLRIPAVRSRRSERQISALPTGEAIQFSRRTSAPKGLKPVMLRKGVLDAQVSVLSGKDGPKPPSNHLADAASQLYQSGHSQMVQHLSRVKVGKVPVATTISIRAYHPVPA